MNKKPAGILTVVRMIAATVGAGVICSTAHALAPDVLFEQISPSIWTILTHDAKRNPIAQGSAVVIGPGKLITNCHVLARASTIQVTKENISYLATLEFPDTERDLCQISVRNFSAAAVKLGSTKPLKVGQRVYAIGNPRGFELSMSEGIISSLRAKSDEAPLIQTTTPISAGSSGGGLFDSEGQLIGITTFGVKDSQNLNFAHPVDWIEQIPERAKIQLAKYKEAQSAAATAIPQAAPDKILTSAELRTLLRYTRQFKLIALPGLEKLVFYGYGDVQAQFGMVTRGGQHYLKTGADQLCLKFHVQSSARILPYLNDCFTVSLVSERRYKFTSTDQKFIMIGEL